MTQSGIEPAIFRFVAQHLNHCATAVPIIYIYIYIYIRTHTHTHTHTHTRVICKHGSATLPGSCFTPLCYQAPYQFTLNLNLRRLIFGLTLIGWFISIS